jgi:hypothetical protein
MILCHAGILPVMMREFCLCMREYCATMREYYPAMREFYRLIMFLSMFLIMFLIMYEAGCEAEISFTLLLFITSRRK